STRTRNAPDRMCLYVDMEEHELGDHNEPTNYKAALSDPESKKWLEALNGEMQSMKDNKVCDLVDILLTVKPLVASGSSRRRPKCMAIDIKRELRVTCYTDVGILTDANDSKSQTRYIFVLNRGVVDWKIARNSIIETSSKEAKYMAASEASKKAL
ncbi:hypothetical protein Tco_1199734, partial [Tanacetum coccineum]